MGPQTQVLMLSLELRVVLWALYCTWGDWEPTPRPGFWYACWSCCWRRPSESGAWSGIPAFCSFTWRKKSVSSVCNGTTGHWMGERTYSTSIYRRWQWTPEQLCSGVAKDGAWTKQSLAWWMGNRMGCCKRRRAWLLPKHLHRGHTWRRKVIDWGRESLFDLKQQSVWWYLNARWVVRLGNTKSAFGNWLPEMNFSGVSGNIPWWWGSPRCSAVRWARSHL